MRVKILNERLEALERDNEEEENVNETELYEESESVCVWCLDEG